MALLALEALGLIAAAGVVLDKIVTGHPSSVGLAWGQLALALFGALVLALCARSLLKLRAGARAPVLVIQLLALPVAYSLAFQASRPEYGAPILLVALATLYLLMTPQSREALGR